MAFLNPVNSFEPGQLGSRLAARLPKASPTQRRRVVAVTLVVSDFAAMVLALIVTRTIGLVFYHDYGSTGIVQCAIEGLFLAAIYAVAGLYTGRGPSPFERLRKRALGAAFFCALHVGLHGTVSIGGIEHSIILFLALVGLGHYAELFSRLWLERQGLWCERALIIGDGARVEQLIAELKARPLLGFRPIAVMGSNETGAAAAMGNWLAGLPVVASLEMLPEPVDVAIAVDAGSLANFESSVAGSQAIANTLLLIDGPNGESLWLPTRALGGGVGLEVGRSRNLDQSAALKRAIDLILIGLVALPASILVAIAVAAVRIVDPGPVFHVQRRIGLNGRQFGVLKVRSMYQDADERLEAHLASNPDAKREWERNFKLRNDPRILPYIGKIIRKSSIDELPQLWNVACGSMSLVGPRPFPEYHLNGFDREFQEVRSTVQPGLTGLWQVSDRSDGDLETQKSQDLFYIRNRSLWMDLYIILQTVPAVLSARGAR